MLLVKCGKFRLQSPTVHQAGFQCVWGTWSVTLGATNRDSGYLVRVLRLLVYMCPPTSMWTGALVLVSLAGVGMPVEPRGDRETSCWLDILLLLRPSCGGTSGKEDMTGLCDLICQPNFLLNNFTFHMRFNSFPPWIYHLSKFLKLHLQTIHSQPCRR